MKLGMQCGGPALHIAASAPCSIVLRAMGGAIFDFVFSLFFIVLLLLAGVTKKKYQDLSAEREGYLWRCEGALNADGFGAS